MIEEIKNITSKKSDLRKFSIVIGTVLFLIAGLFYWKEKESFQIFLTTGVVFCLLGIIIPVVLKPIYWAWMIFANILGWVMTRVKLSLLFYTVITPTGVVLRLLGKRFLGTERDESKENYWNYRITKAINREDCERQF